MNDSVDADDPAGAVVVADEAPFDWTKSACLGTLLGRGFRALCVFGARAARSFIVSMIDGTGTGSGGVHLVQNSPSPDELVAFACSVFRVAAASHSTSRPLYAALRSAVITHVAKQDAAYGVALLRSASGMVRCIRPCGRVCCRKLCRCRLLCQLAYAM